MNIALELDKVGASVIGFAAVKAVDDSIDLVQLLGTGVDKLKFQAFQSLLNIDFGHGKFDR